MPSAVEGDSTRVFGYCSERYSGGPVTCDWVRYFVILGVLSGLGFGAIFIFFTVVVAWPTYYLARYCCKCCGSNQRREGCCCTKKGSNAVYTLSGIRLSKLMMLFVLLLASAGLIIGFVGNSSVEKAWNGTFDAASAFDSYESSLANQAANIVSTVNSVVIPIAKRNGLTTLTSGVIPTSNLTTFRVSLITTMLLQFRSTLPGSSPFQNSVLQDFRTALATDVNSWVSRCKHALQPIEDARTTAVMIALIVPVGVLFFGVVCAIGNIRRYFPMVIVFFLFPVAALAWLNFAIHGTGWFLFDDVVYGIEQFQKGTYPLFVHSTGCDQFFDIRQTYNKALTLLQQGVCNFLSSSSLCTTQTQVVGASTVAVDPFRCTNTAAFVSTCTVATPAQVIAIQTTSKTAAANPIQPEYSTLCANGLDSSGTCTIAQCATSCKNSTIGIVVATKAVAYCDLPANNNCSGLTAVRVLPPLQPIAADVVALESSVTQLKLGLTQLVLPHMDCYSIISALVGRLADPCRNARKGFLLIMIGGCVEACAVTFGIAVLSTGQKRWFNVKDIKNKKWLLPTTTTTSSSPPPSLNSDPFDTLQPPQPPLQGPGDSEAFKGSVAVISETPCPTPLQLQPPAGT